MSQRKPFTLDSKKKILSQGINASTKAQRKKIDNANKNLTLPEVSYAKVYMYQNSNWQYKGQSCMLCKKIINDDYVLLNHRYVCEENILKHKNVGTD